MPKFCVYQYPNGAGCITQCTFGYPNGHSRWCKIHAPEGAINVKDTYLRMIARSKIKYDDQ